MFVSEESAELISTMFMRIYISCSTFEKTDIDRPNQMSRLKRTLEIILTNWVHLVGFYVTTYLTAILFKLFGLDNWDTEIWSMVLLVYPLTIPVLFFTYGLMFIGGFFGAVIILDSIAFNLPKTKTELILYIEWIIIVSPFIIWAFEYEYWLWLTLALSFLVTQWIRRKKIEKIKEKRATTKNKANAAITSSADQDV